MEGKIKFASSNYLLRHSHKFPLNQLNNYLEYLRRKFKHEAFEYKGVVQMDILFNFYCREYSFDNG